MIVVEQLQTVNLPADNLEDTIQFYNLFFDFELMNCMKSLLFCLLTILDSN